MCTTMSDNGGDFYEKTPEELKRERDRKRYANMSEDARRRKSLKKIWPVILIIICHLET